MQLSRQWYTTVSLQCHCLLDIFTVHSANQLWKSPLVFLNFYFPSVSFRHLNFPSHLQGCQVGLVHEVELVGIFYYRKATPGLRLTNKPCWSCKFKVDPCIFCGLFHPPWWFLLSLKFFPAPALIARKWVKEVKVWGDWEVKSYPCLDGGDFTVGRKERILGKRSKKHQGTRCLTKWMRSCELKVLESVQQSFCVFSTWYSSLIFLCAQAVQSSEHIRWDMSKSLFKESWAFRS